MDVACQNGAKLASKWHQKSISTLNAENQLNVSQLAFSWLSGVEVGSKHRPKNDPKMESKMECILASIFKRFWWILGAKLGQVGGKLALNIDGKSIQKGLGVSTLLWGRSSAVGCSGVQWGCSGGAVGCSGGLDVGLGVGSWAEKCGQHGSNLASKMKPRWPKNPSRNRSFC